MPGGVLQQSVWWRLALVRVTPAALVTYCLCWRAQIDKEGANVERVKQELSEAGLLPEEWGGQTAMVPVSAHPPHSPEHCMQGLPASL